MPNSIYDVGQGADSGDLSSVAVPSSFTIQEVDPTVPSQLSTTYALVLSQRALPYWTPGLTLQRKMRHVITWYPGSPVGSIQVLGSKHEPTRISGKWKNRFVKNPASVTPLLPGPSNSTTAFNPPAVYQGSPCADAKAIADAFEELLQRGQLLRVTWDQVVRQGILSDFKWTYERRQDIAWEAEFTWISDGTAQGPAAIGQAPDIGTIIQPSMTAATQDLTDSAVTPFEQLASFGTAFNDKINQVQAALSEVGDTVGNVVATVLAPVDAARRTAGLLTQIAGTATDIVNDTQSSVYYELAAIQNGYFSGSFKQPFATNIDLPFGMRMLIEHHRRTILRASRRASVQAAQHTQDLISQSLQPQIIAAFVVRANTNLRDISNRFYGTPDGWRQVAQFNDLPSSIADAGTTIYIPKYVQPTTPFNGTGIPSTSSSQSQTQAS